MYIDLKQAVVQAENCPVCTGPGYFFYRDEGRALEYLACSDCESIFLRPDLRLDLTAEKKRYELHDNDPDDPGYRAFLNPLLNQILQDQPRGSKGLDFGCGPTASFRRLLGEAGYLMSAYDVFFDPNAKALQSKYDFVVASEVFEHFYEPRIEVARLRKTLDRGALWVMTSVFEQGIDFATWSYRSDPTHVIFYTPKALLRLASEFGFAAPERKHSRVWKLPVREGLTSSL